MSNILPVKKYLNLLLILLIISMAGCACSSDSHQAKAANASVLWDDSHDMAAPFVIDGIPINSNAGVVTDTVVDVYSEPDVRSERVTQAIFNQPVRILEEDGGWIKAYVVDGSTGWIRSKFISSNTSSLNMVESTQKIVVTSREKSIYSYPSGGITLKRVLMGTELYAFNESGDACEVYLPGNTTGWLIGSGMIHLGVDEAIPLTKREDFVASALKFKGVSYLIHGLSTMGVDAPGMVYICAGINGVKLPRDLKGLLSCGTGVEIDKAVEGDLVFLGSGRSSSDISGVGICTGDGNYIYAGRNTGYVAIGSLKGQNPDGIPVAVRRIFQQ